MMERSVLLAQIHEALVELRLERDLERRADSVQMRDAALIRRLAAEDRMFALLCDLDRGNGLAALADLARHEERLVS